MTIWDDKLDDNVSILMRLVHKAFCIHSTFFFFDPEDSEYKQQSFVQRLLLTKHALSSQNIFISRSRF